MFKKIVVGTDGSETAAIAVAYAADIAAAIGHLPETGEELTLGRFHFRVGHADSRRIHRFLVNIHGG